ncbi:MAG: hypothetical protein H6Q48_1296, partial [Deltaproteobacteria bacterium]|nr:hypothetical protein [Deltaproteobacteria bacterium]
MKSNRFYAFGVVMVALVFLFCTSVDAAPAKDKIRVGWVTSLSGVNAPGVMVTSGN